MLDLFRLVGGIDIQNDALTSNVYFLQGSGVPGADGDVQDAAPIGSLYSRTDVSGTQLQQYSKIANAGATSDWVVLASTVYVDNAINGISWREPAVVRDSATTLPTGTATQPITVDGVSITNGQRVLFSGLTANPNVYVYNQAAGTFTQDANTATAGDALFVTDGTSKGNRWTFNGTDWVLFGVETDVTEITFIDTFIGKPGIGSITPTYTSNYIVATGNSLTSAISSLDVALGSGSITNTGASYALSSNLAFTGPAPGGNGSLTVTAAINALNSAIGNQVYTTGTNYVIPTGVTTLAGNIDLLNVAVHDIIVATLSVTGTVSTNPEVFAVADSIPASAASEITWQVQVRETATPGNRRASEVHAITDGTTVDFTRFAELKLAGGVAGYGIAVVINGANLELQLKATAGYDYVVKRVAVSSF